MKNKLIIRLFINYLIFIFLRYLNIFVGFGLGFGAAPHYQKWYVEWLHLPSLIIHITFLLFLRKKWGEKDIAITILFLVLIFLVSQFRLGNLLLLPK